MTALQKSSFTPSEEGDESPATAEIREMRIVQLYFLSDRLGAMRNFDWGRLFVGVGVLAIGGLMGIWGSGAKHPDHTLIVALIVLAITCFAARFAIGEKEIDSIGSIKRELDALLALHADDELLSAVREVYERGSRTSPSSALVRLVRQARRKPSGGKS